jgi:hypothetical protein
MKINWKRIAWIIFIYLYTGLFFYNCLRPFDNWFVSYIYTMLLIIWLGIEYYQKRLFFQSGFIPFELYMWPLRALFALFFYSSFIIGISTIVWWYKNQIGLYPLIQIIGVAILIYSIYLRWQILSAKKFDISASSKFYLSITVLIVSLALGYGSYFLVIYTILIGFILVFLQYKFENNRLKEFEKFVHDTQKITKINPEDYEKLWLRFLNKQSKKKKKK